MSASFCVIKRDDNSLDCVCEDITKIQITSGGQTTYLTETASYEYDVSGNIIKITSDDNITRYQYDELNRLIREDNPYLKKTYIYHYDRAGNIIYKRAFDYNTDPSELPREPELIEFIYDCDNRDRLILFGDKHFAYDKAGRPTTYKNATFTWNSLNQLIGIGKNISYMYDANGFIRKKKVKVGDVETLYITNGSQILSMKTGDVTLIFRYVLNKLIGFNYNNGVSTKEYIYQRNALGDIIGIFDDEGKQVGGYAYDAYGNYVVTYGVDEEIATLNPFRYRGYFWDDDAQLYYLNSRYYDPETGRFISPDTLAILDETKGQINGLNLYMYCKNNPIMFVDPSGYFLAAIFGTIFGALIGGINALISGKSFWAGFAAGAIGGFISGLALDIGVVTGGIGGLIFAGFVGAIGGGLGDALGQVWVDGKSWNELDFGQIIISGVIAGIGNLLTFGFGSIAFDSKVVEGAGIFKNLVYQVTKATGTEIFMNVVFGWIVPYITALPSFINGVLENKKSDIAVFASQY